MDGFMSRSSVALASGVPRQELGTFSERLLLPLVLCAFAPLLSTFGLALAVVATALAFLPRLVAAALFRQSLGSALLHPLGVLALLAIQWHALGRHFLGRPAEWKGRAYGLVAAAHPVKSGMKVFILALVTCLPAFSQGFAGEASKPPAHAPASIELRDQYDATQRLAFPATNVVVLTIADSKGSDQIDGWVEALKARYAGRKNFLPSSTPR